MAICFDTFSVSATLRIDCRTGNSSASNLSVTSLMMPQMSTNGHSRRIWRRRKLDYNASASLIKEVKHEPGTLVKKDPYLDAKMERVPFLEEQVRILKEGEGQFGGDVARLLLSEENRYDFVNQVAAEANELVENNRDEYGGLKKAIYHAISNRMNEAGFYRPEAYAEPDPYKPPGFWREDDY